ncbi:MAG TPA: winged helix-turn-helix domain-containing protein [Eubacteriaceae bacterium]|jgi:DNA-binding Lrp family transcriptional regulator|nr:winged helix-turn-helix domain-containing protein [Eubacteriaceae bacterium]
MLKEILRIINREGYISIVSIAKELNISGQLVEDGVKQLVRMCYILEEKTGEDCSTFCGNCPFAKNCSKEIVKTYNISDKGINFLKK